MKFLISAVAFLISTASIATENPDITCYDRCYTRYLKPECSWITDAFGFRVRTCNRGRTERVCERVCSDPFGPDA